MGIKFKWVNCSGYSQKVSFTDHFIERFVKRAEENDDMENFSWSSIFVSIRENIFFEMDKLADGQDCLVLYKKVEKGSDVLKFFGRKATINSDGEFFYKVGYAPVEYLGNGILRLKTLLYTGMSQTREGAFLRKSSFPLFNKVKALNLLKSGELSFREFLKKDSLKKVYKMFDERGLKQIKFLKKEILESYKMAA